MARRSHDEYSNSSDDRSRDLTAQFWGSSPAWRTTGTLRRVRRNGDRTGPVERTRRHGDRTGQIPLVAAVPIEEPLIDPYDFGFDDVGYGPDAAIAARRIETSRRPSAHDRADARPLPDVELIELDERGVAGSRDPVSTLAERLGLGAVDPLLLRLGVIVMIGVLLVPVAMGFRSGTSEGSVRTDVAAGSSTQQVILGDAPVVEQVAPTGDSAGVNDTTPDTGASGEPAAAPSTSSDDADVAAEPIEQSAPTGQSETTASGGDAPKAAALSDVAETVSAPQPTTHTAPGAAEADEPANRVAPVCQLSYTVVAGDYWIRIADATGTSLSKLLQANLATVVTPLYAGDEICLPEGATPPAPPTTTTPPSATAPPTTDAPTTSPTTTTPAPPVTAPPAPGVIEDIIREIWPDDLEVKALEIAWRESGYQPNAQNWCCYGLFQIHWTVHRSWLDDIGVTSSVQLLDARTNARAAYALYQRSGGWGPWGG